MLNFDLEKMIVDCCIIRTQINTLIDLISRNFQIMHDLNLKGLGLYPFQGQIWSEKIRSEGDVWGRLPLAPDFRSVQDRAELLSLSVYGYLAIGRDLSFSHHFVTVLISININR